MSELLALAAVLAFTVVSAVVGARLLLLARRTHQLPEFCVGLGLLTVGAIGYPLSIVARLGVGGAAVGGLTAISVTASATGSAAIYYFTWSVFRRGAVWAKLLCGAATVAMLAYAGDGVLRSFTEPPGWLGQVDAWFVLMQVATIFSYAWTAVEAFRYYRMLRRRLSLGLADPIVANRFFLWFLSGVFASAGSGVVTLLAAVGGQPYDSVAGRAAVGLGGLAASVVLALAFVPPRAYLRWVRGAAGTTG
jgi:hypothetical protein